MKITYLAHSGFCIQIDKLALIFDYFEGEIPALETDTTIYVFSSHRHYDHFSFDIFKLALNYPNIHFILSFDIGKKYNRNYIMRKAHISEETYSKISYMNANVHMEFKDLAVDTLKSTDLGVAFIVHVSDFTIYHAGDLNWWTWNGETDEEYKNMTSRFKEEIEKIRNQHFNVAFLPIDPRQEDRFYLGFDYYMQNVSVDTVFPMHFWNDYTLADKLKSMDCSKNYKDKIVTICKNGQQFSI